jgi:hypothetical protein
MPTKRERKWGAKPGRQWPIDEPPEPADSGLTFWHTASVKDPDEDI